MRGWSIYNSYVALVQTVRSDVTPNCNSYVALVQAALGEIHPFTIARYKAETA